MFQDSVHRTEQLLFFTLLQLSVIVLSARVVGNLAVRYGNSRAVGEIVAGLILGPSLFGFLWPELFGFVFRSAPPEPLTILSQVGLILLLFQIGLEFDFSRLRNPRNRLAVLRIALVGEVFSFALGFIFGQSSAPLLFSAGDAFAYSLFCATAFSITALPILGRIMMDLNLHRTEVGAIAISASAINDVAGWLLLAVVSALSVANFSAWKFALELFLLAVYLVVCWCVVRPLLIKLLRSYAVTATTLPLDVLGILLTITFVSGMATYKIGVFAIFGGFMLGVLLHDQHELVAAWRSKVGDFVNVFFVPIYFTYTGLRTDIGVLNGWQMWGWCAVLLACATLGKFGGCYWAARWVGLVKSEAIAIGALMNTRGLMELVVINVGYDLGVIPKTVYTMLVIMAITSTIVTAPVVKRSLRIQRVAEFKQDSDA